MLGLGLGLGSGLKLRVMVVRMVRNIFREPIKREVDWEILQDLASRIFPFLCVLTSMRKYRTKLYSISVVIHDSPNGVDHLSKCFDKLDKRPVWRRQIGNVLWDFVNDDVELGGFFRITITIIVVKKCNNMYLLNIMSL